jgi:hypothetical protein
MNFYHGSKTKFSKFDKPGSGKHGPGFYFTPSRNEAMHFAKTLAGDGSSGQFLYEVDLLFNNPFNTMSVEHCSQVARSLNLAYRVPEFAGGAKEHYHHLLSQMKKRGLIDSDSELNALIKTAGFDAIFYNLMEHVIVFDENQIEIISSENLKKD